jgi:hypothetical protein
VRQRGEPRSRQQFLFEERRSLLRVAEALSGLEARARALIPSSRRTGSRELSGRRVRNNLTRGWHPMLRNVRNLIEI